MNLAKIGLVFGLLLLNVTTKAQTGNDLFKTIVRIGPDKNTTGAILTELSSKYGIVFSYEPSEIPVQRPVKLSKPEMTLKDLLDEVFRNAEIIYMMQSNIIILRKDVAKNKKKTFSVSGIIRDSKSSETLPGASVYVAGLNVGDVTNEYGFYSITVPQGSHKLQFSCLGYRTISSDTAVTENLRLDVDLNTLTYEISEVVVNNAHDRLYDFQQGMSKIEMKSVKELPSLFGEADLLRNIQLMPGVTSMAELGGDFQVRGGSWDQNLMMLDEALVYNSNHLMGIYSTFNPDIIKDIKFYKGGIPANYGGRISSVMDIAQKEGNMKSFHFNGGIGLIASRLTVESPIVKDKVSFIVAARRSTFEPFMKYADNEEAKKSRPYFYDINSKVNYLINKNNRIYLSVYSGKDVAEVEQYSQNYGNITATLRYNHIFGERLFSNTSLVYSHYKMQAENSTDVMLWKANLGLEHYEFKNDFVYALSKQKIEFGLRSVLYTFHPGEQQTENGSDNKAFKIPDQKAWESALYLLSNFKVAPTIEIQLGVRLSNFNLMGPANVFVYQTGVPRNPIEIIDTLYYSNNEIVDSYTNFEPRISLKFNVKENQTLTFSYNKMVQYVQLVSSTFNPLPNDMWKPANNYIKPLMGNQYAVSWFMHTHGLFDISAETYYKTLRNVLEVKPGTETILNSNLDAGLLQGVGRAYGIELAVYKIKGKLTGSVTYTLSRTEKKIDGAFLEEKINFGKYYKADYDIPHKITLAGIYKLNNRVSFTSNFIYQTGRPVTYPAGQYTYFNILIPYYSAKNESRYPAFHHLDIGTVVQSKKKTGRRWEGAWTFSVYNVYGRENYYYAGIRRKSNSQNTEMFKMWFFSIVPSVSYSFKF